MGVIWNWLRALVGIEPEEAKALTDQFFATLRAYASAIPANADPPAGRARLQELLDKGPFEWPTAYEIEQLMTHYYDPVTLKMELGRRVLESENVLPEGHKGWYEEEHKKATSEKATSEIVQRALLLRLINDLQWRYTLHEAKRSYSKQIMRRTSGILLLAIVAAVVMAAILLYRIDSGEPQAFSWESMLLAAFAGSWGAAFSMMVGLRDRLEKSTTEEVRFARVWPLLFSRNLIGVGAALILFFFLQAGMLAGSAFPEIQQGASLISKDVALLVVWCFIAGFSEKLVPHLLGQAERRAQGEENAQTPGTDRTPVGATATAQQKAADESARKAAANENERQE